jgi:TATA-box binding protein (TBP) (component of TFIID and TFIIIB)
MNILEMSESKTEYYTKILPKDFDDIKVSTKTIIMITNIILNIDELFDNLPIVHYEITPKKRGRKKKSEITPIENLEPGSIITMKYKNKIKGVDLKQKKTELKSKSFRNSLTMVMMLKDKKINFKISSNGKFQIVGCKTWKHGLEVIEYLWEMIRNNTKMYSLQPNTDLTALFIPAMRNIDFSTGFKIDREKLDHHIKDKTNYTSILETSFGYTGVNIKIPIKKSVKEFDQINMVRFVNEKWTEPELVDYKDYINALPLKESKKIIEKKRFTTFLVFHSGKCIMSSINKSLMKDTYYEFVDLMRKCRNIIEEKLIV